MDKTKEGFLKNLIMLLRKISLFGTCVNVVWCVIIIGLAYFLDCNRMILLPLSDSAGIVGCVVVVVVGLFLWFRLRNNKEDKTTIIIYQAYFFWIPFVISIIKVLFFDSLYVYEGGMFPGLDALGAFIGFIYTAVLSAIGCIFFNVVRIIRKKRIAAGKEDTWLVKLNDFINVAFVVVVLVLTIGFSVSYCVESVKKHNHKQQLARNEAYRSRVLSGLKESELFSKAMYDTPEEQLCWEAYTYSLYVEMMAQGDLVYSDDLKGVGVTTITKEVLNEGKEDYISFTKRYVPTRHVEMSHQVIACDEKTQTVSVSSELYCEDIETNSSVSACMVVVFDKDWKVVQIRCQDHALKQYVSY
ncbi:MAG: hypothetical protein K6G76_03875 [Lachnospiraceae bacterium]|nr:hypothetical protein [Lachnospiraceae bacterium]